MTIAPEMLRRVLGSSAEEGGMSAADVRGILQIACLAVASDGNIADEEVDAVRVFASALGGKQAARDAESLIDEAARFRTREEQLDRLRATADALSGEAARHLAYKVSVATAMADLASADEEFEFDIDVQDALKLSPEEADGLAGEVHKALSVQELSVQEE
jgi:hypothetical protein